MLCSGDTLLPWRCSVHFECIVSCPGSITPHRHYVLHFCWTILLSVICPQNVVSEGVLCKLETHSNVFGQQQQRCISSVKHNLSHCGLTQDFGGMHLESFPLSYGSTILLLRFSEICFRSGHGSYKLNLPWEEHLISNQTVLIIITEQEGPHTGHTQSFNLRFRL